MSHTIVQSNKIEIYECLSHTLCLCLQSYGYQMGKLVHCIVSPLLGDVVLNHKLVSRNL